MGIHASPDVLLLVLLFLFVCWFVCCVYRFDIVECYSSGGTCPKRQVDKESEEREESKEKRVKLNNSMPPEIQ